MAEVKNAAYSALAAHYEYLIADCDYEKWSQYVCDKVAENAPNHRGADIACGSGFFTRSLKKRGYDVFGYDISGEMLGEARRLSAESGLSIEFVQGDIKSFKSLKKLGFVTAINDGFNYVEPENLLKAFKAVSRNLVKGGMFLFDVSSEYKLRNVIGNNLFSVDDDDVTYIWFNKLENDKVIMDITVFERNDDVYIRKDERHEQYIHSLPDIKSALISAGFEIKEISGSLDGELNEKSERLYFLGVKK